MDEHFCEICNQTTKPFNTIEQLITIGWKEMKGQVNGIKYDFYFCPKHLEEECAEYFIKWAKRVIARD